MRPRLAGLVALVAGTLAATGVVAMPHAAAPSPRPDRRPAAAPPTKPRRPSGTRLDGVIEGFYGPAWSYPATRTIFRFLSAHHLTSFVYAPKGDPYQRAKWNLPYPPNRLHYLAELVAAARSSGIRFIYSVSPGLTIDYTSTADRNKLLAKIDQVKALGVNTFMLSFDDIPTNGNLYDLAVAQSKLADAVLHAERRTDPGFRLLFTPTEYWGTKPNAYWTGLKHALYQGIDVIWTGPWVLSKTITAAEAQAVEADMGHRVVIWDNYPVNDYTYSQPPHHPHLFLGPLVGRGARLPQVVAGYFFNPMLQPLASEPALWTGAAYLNHPSRYNPETSWVHALPEIGAGAPKAFARFAEANVSSYLGYPLQTPLPGLVSAYWAGRGKGLKAYFRAMARADETIGRHLIDRQLAGEIGPWLTLYSREGRAGSLALRLLAIRRQGGTPPPAEVSRLAADARIIAANPYSLDTTASVVQFLQRALLALHRP